MKTLLKLWKVVLLAGSVLILTTGMSQPVIEPTGTMASAGMKNRVQWLAQASLLTMQIGRDSSLAIEGENRDSFTSLQNHHQMLLHTVAQLQSSAEVSQKMPWIATMQSLDQKIQVLLERKEALHRLAETTASVNTLGMQLLDLSEQIVALTTLHKESPRNIMATTQLRFLNQRLVQNFTALHLQNEVDPETVFLIGKDAQMLQDLAAGLLRGSDALGVTPVHRETGDRLEEWVRAFARMERQMAVTRLDLPKILAAKRTYLEMEQQGRVLQTELLQALSARSAI